jgi:predicted permease
LLVAEVSLAMVLLSSAGLLVRSFVKVLRFESGFDASNTLTAGTSLGGDRYQSVQEVRRFAEKLLPRLQALPGVDSAALASALPLGLTQKYFITFDDNPNPSMFARQIVAMISITPDYFHVMRTPTIQGRAFNAQDTASSERTVIVTRAFAHRFLLDDAVGKRFRVSELVGMHLVFEPATIVGVAEDVRHGGLEQDVQPEFFVPMDQVPSQEIELAVRSQIAAISLTDSMRKAVTAVDREQPLFNVETMDQRVSNLIGQRRFMMLLMACFAVIAVFLSGVGVYGVFAYSVSQRTQEMGIRLALGASRGGLLRLVVMQAAQLIALGGLIGVNCAMVLSRLLSNSLVGVTPHDAMTLTLAWVLMTTVALLGSAIPALQAARTDLISVLHSE